MKVPVPVNGGTPSIAEIVTSEVPLTHGIKVVVAVATTVDRSNST